MYLLSLVFAATTFKPITTVVAKQSDTLKQLLLNAAKRSDTSKQLLSNGAKQSETDPPKAQAQRIYIPLGGLPPKARNPLFALSLSLLSLIISYLRHSSTWNC